MNNSTVPLDWKGGELQPSSGKKAKTLLTTLGQSA